MQLEIGKTYRTEGGEKVKITGATPRRFIDVYGAPLAGKIDRATTIFYHPDGRQSKRQHPAYRIVGTA